MLKYFKKIAFSAGILASTATISWNMYCSSMNDDTNDIINFDRFKDSIEHDISKIKLFSVNSNRELAREVAFFLNLKLGRLRISNYEKGNDSHVEILETVRGKNVYLICGISQDRSINENLIDLLLAISAARRANANKVYVIMPYFFYMRQDSYHDGHRKALFLGDVTRLIQSMGAYKIITVNLHRKDSKGYFDLPLIQLDVHRLCVSHFKTHQFKDLTIVCPNYQTVTQASHVKAGLEENGIKNIDIGVIGGTNTSNM
jgi:ribose-phosphate pyrophosphokinase